MPGNTVLSHERVETGSYSVTTAEFPTSSINDIVSANADQVAAEWASSFSVAVAAQDFAELSNLFLSESYWRDHLCLSWEFHTLKGPKQIIAFFLAAKNGCRLKTLKVDDTNIHRKPTKTALDYDGKVPAIQAFLTTENDIGRGLGVVRLVKNSGRWKAYTLYTSMRELSGYEEPLMSRRPEGVEHGGKPGRLNWKDRRAIQEEFKDTEPAVLVVGAGQAGLTSAARLKMLGVETLVVDREDRVGDNWRLRYHQLVLHDPVWYDHLPYLSFPAHWPIFTPKDKLGDWFEGYAKVLELDVWTKTTLVSSLWSDENRRWTVTLERENSQGIETRVVHPRHIVQATGHSGEKNLPNIKGIESFKGVRLAHSSQFSGADKIHGQGRKAVIVGCCNSGHDIAQDFYENGYDVTIVQRSSTFVVSVDTNIKIGLAGVYEEGGPEVDDADALLMSTPNPVLKRSNIDVTTEMLRRDHKLHEGLAKAGFKIDKGPDDSGLLMKYFQRGGGYYIDVGASQLIIDGKVKIKQGQEIMEVKEQSLLFSDGTELPADEIVFATGYQNMRSTARKIFGDELADRVADVWGLDQEGELRTAWRSSGHPGFWFAGGNLALCRYFSRFLALQIKGLEEGIWTLKE
ncbi:putative oxidoreductase [Hyphodiscus hymeniophilus]|uniref:Oxidoreductase n=1 Tax=Hyphodiscus hymeniophilus TaxID=353542 RepID=A0A9P6VJY9_9HELO|nr:putative oxidoreductase [Hyphodiscus hymeniophilus]